MYADLSLALQCEGAELAASRAAFESWNRKQPGGGMVEAAGGVAFYFGVDSPLSQVLHAGLRGEVTEAEWRKIEDLYRENGAPIHVSLCPLADQSLIDLLGRRGYSIVQMENTLCRKLAPGEHWPAVTPRVLTHAARPEDFEQWSRAFQEGFFSLEQDLPEIRSLARAFFEAPHTVPYCGYYHGVLGAVACLLTLGDTALFAGDATRPAFRARGMQRALITERLRHAAASGVRLAVACALAGSSSQKNYERMGFRVAYTKAILRKELSG